MDLRERRVALGWSRAELATRAQIDRRSLQLLELGLSADTESLAKALDTLAAADGLPGAPDPVAADPLPPLPASAPNDAGES